MPATLVEAGFSVAELAGQAAQADAVGPVETVSEVGVERVVADKGYHSKQALQIWLRVARGSESSYGDWCVARSRRRPLTQH
jgi:hypothetical protein